MLYYYYTDASERLERLKQEAGSLHYAIEAEDPWAANAIYGTARFRDVRET